MGTASSLSHDVVSQQAARSTDSSTASHKPVGGCFGGRHSRPQSRREAKPVGDSPVDGKPVTALLSGHATQRQRRRQRHWATALTATPLGERTTSSHATGRQPGGRQAGDRAIGGTPLSDTASGNATG